MTCSNNFNINLPSDLCKLARMAKTDKQVGKIKVRGAEIHVIFFVDVILLYEVQIIIVLTIFSIYFGSVFKTACI